MPGVLNRLALLLLSLTAVASQANGEVTADDWSRLFNALRTESWTSAAELSLDLLARLPESADDERARLRYTYLSALSGNVVAGELSHDELRERIAPMIGERISLPPRLVADPSTHGPMFNQIAKTDTDAMVMSIAASSDASAIHAFEYARLAAPVDLAALAGRAAELSGRLERVDPHGSRTFAARVYLDDARLDPV